MQPTIRAIVSDLDDTLLDSQHRLSERTERTLRRLIAQGVIVVLASGRSAASVRPYARQIGSPYPYVGFNGAHIVDGKTDRILHATEIDTDLAREALRWFEDRGIYAQYYLGDDWYYEKRCALSDEYGRSSGIEGKEAGMRLSDFVDAPAPKLLGMAEPSDVPGLIAASRAVFGDALSITTSKPYFIEVTSPLATKGNACQQLEKLIGIAPETTLCAGDSLNDLTMLRWSKLPVTVKNARDEVKAECWHTGDYTNNEDGLARLLDQLIPEETYAH